MKVTESAESCIVVMFRLLKMTLLTHVPHESPNVSLAPPSQERVVGHYLNYVSSGISIVLSRQKPSPHNYYKWVAAIGMILMVLI